MTEVRTTSSTGGQKGVKPERHSLIPRKATAAIARVFGFGAGKYSPVNWRRKYEWSKSIDALQRHIDAFVDGETFDPESGLPHLAHAGFHLMVLLTWLEEDGEGGEFDDRWPHLLRREIEAEADDEEPGPLPKEWGDMGFTSLDGASVTIEHGPVSSEVFKMLTGYSAEEAQELTRKASKVQPDKDEVRQSIQVHFNGVGFDSIDKGREMDQILRDMAETRRMRRVRSGY